VKENLIPKRKLVTEKKKKNNKKIHIHPMITLSTSHTSHEIGNEAAIKSQLVEKNK
jgi:hypothetical protein